jgi:hypothetical protein
VSLRILIQIQRSDHLEGESAVVRIWNIGFPHPFLEHKRMDCYSGCDARKKNVRDKGVTGELVSAGGGGAERTKAIFGQVT